MHSIPSPWCIICLVGHESYPVPLQPLALPRIHPDRVPLPCELFALSNPSSDVGRHILEITTARLDTAAQTHRPHASSPPVHTRRPIDSSRDSPFPQTGRPLHHIVGANCTRSSQRAMSQSPRTAVLTAQVFPQCLLGSSLQGLALFEPDNISKTW